MLQYHFNPKEHKSNLLKLLSEIINKKEYIDKDFHKILRMYPKDNGKLYSKSELIEGYRFLVAEGELDESKELVARIRMKPTRSISGVLPVTILTRPFPCPGKCIFCPNDVRMPKSYLSDEPGAQRAERNNFDPYLQTYNRLAAYEATGHNLEKVEIIILGGTWSYYPEQYQLWFIKRCFEAMNDYGAGKDQREQIKTKNIYFQDQKSKPKFDNSGKRKTYNELVSEIESQMLEDSGEINETDYSTKINKEVSSWDELIDQQKINESGSIRCVGLVIETRPDHINQDEVIRIRKFGSTKTQIGYQSLQEEVLKLNNRGHNVAATARAAKLVRSAGFKLHVHWMPNLYGSNVEKDKEDYKKLFTPDFVPDELKIYPCSLIETAELMDYYEKGLWKPYTQSELLEVLANVVINTPRYVRLTRVIRDIPSQDIVVGNKKTNFRQIVDNYLKERGLKSKDIRAREIRNKNIGFNDLELKITKYQGNSFYGPTTEYFLEYITADDEIAGFLRLSLPSLDEGLQKDKHFIEELTNSAIIREVHVYGVAQNLGRKGIQTAQHLGLGKRLIEKATEIATNQNYTNLAVISAIGTKEYYKKRGFEDGFLYQHLSL